MIAWKRQSGAVVGAIDLAGGRRARVVLVGGRDHPNGVVAVMPPAAGEAVRPVPFATVLEQVPPQQVIEVLCMQERLFGTGGLPQPEVPDAAG